MSKIVIFAIFHGYFYIVVDYLLAVYVGDKFEVFLFSDDLIGHQHNDFVAKIIKLAEQCTQVHLRNISYTLNMNS